MFEAKILADSINPDDQRITSMLITFPRFILAELNTHRALSKNSASSRAIPFKKMVEAVEKNPFVPMKWMKEHTGMQGSEYIEDQEVIKGLMHGWLAARTAAVGQARMLHDNGLTKQMCNRILEPFAWHTVLITGTEWENFFAQRVSQFAEIHMARIAELMLEAYNHSVPRSLNWGGWHIPYDGDISGYPLDIRLKIATARCARTSYTIVGSEKVFDIDADIQLHDRLLSMGHWSPFEHCACARKNEWSGNFFGWHQYRKDFPEENRRDLRVFKNAWIKPRLL